MAMLLADSNALGNPQLKTYLAASRDHNIALSDLTLVEMRKEHAITNSRMSLRIASQFPSQVFVLKRAHEILELNMSASADVNALFDYVAGVELNQDMLDLSTVPVPERLKVRMAALEPEAANVVAELGKQMHDLEEALVDITKEFKPDQVKQLRTGRDVTEDTRQTLFRLLKETTARFFIDNQQPLNRKSISLTEARGMFAFRYSLCMMIYYILWVQNGRQVGRPEHLRVNDVIDMQLATVGTYFNGVLSTDKLVWNTSHAVRAVLRQFGAFVGEDWVLPESLAAH
ncbi:hypothetical protein FHS95_000314 [Sphingomonas naasensis]|nr:hypothetical protein [Sphingomonas naasensis]NIJ18645.1 hypothetical protein [Sphingomonas naasensis]